MLTGCAVYVKIHGPNIDCNCNHEKTFYNVMKLNYECPVMIINIKSKSIKTENFKKDQSSTAACNESHISMLVTLAFHSTNYDSICFTIVKCKSQENQFKL